MARSFCPAALAMLLVIFLAPAYGAPEDPQPAPLASPAPAAPPNNRFNARLPDPLAPRLLPREDRRFLAEAVAASRYEVEAASLALARSSNPRVVAMAHELRQWHGTAQSELLRFAHLRNMSAPMMDNSHRKTLNRLAKLRGSKFDREYLQTAAVADQRDYGRVLERSLRDVKDPHLREWIEHQLPVAREQQAMAAAALAPRTMGASAARPVVPAKPVPGVITVSGNR